MAPFTVAQRDCILAALPVGGSARARPTTVDTLEQRMCDRVEGSVEDVRNFDVATVMSLRSLERDWYANPGGFLEVRRR